MSFLAVTRRVGGDLSSFLSGTACAFEIFTNLLTAGAGCVEGDTRSDVDGSGLFGSGDRSEARLRLGPIQSTQVQGLKGTRTHALRAGRFLDGVEEENSLMRRMTITSSRASGLRAKSRYRLQS